MSGRPPADDFFKEAIYDQKCVGKDPRQFNQWCMAGNGSLTSTCKDLHGNSGDCQFKGSFSNGTNSSFLFSYDYRCKYGGGYEKWNNRSEQVALNKEQVEKMMLYCEQVLYGLPFNLPWWVILLIVLGCIVGLTIAISLFWRLWLREKLYKRNKSAISLYTSAPFSTSNIESGAISRAQASGNRGSFVTLQSGAGLGSQARRSSHRRPRSSRSDRKTERSR